jgi:hypothetical protein
MNESSSDIRRRRRRRTRTRTRRRTNVLQIFR